MARAYARPEKPFPFPSSPASGGRPTLVTSRNDPSIESRLAEIAFQTKTLKRTPCFSTIMHKVVTVDMERDFLAENRRLADENRALLDKHRVVAFDFLGGIGSGKTLIIEKLDDRSIAKGKKGGALAGDGAGDDDYQMFVAPGGP